MRHIRGNMHASALIQQSVRLRLANQVATTKVGGCMRCKLEKNVEVSLVLCLLNDANFLEQERCDAPAAKLRGMQNGDDRNELEINW